MIGSKLLIAVAPNGARKSKVDHPALPLSSRELIAEAEKCRSAGAAMMHFHVRDRYGNHSLDHRIYAEVLKVLQREVGQEILLQVSSEAAGVYQREQQMEEMKRLAPHCLSIGLREIVGCESDFPSAHRFLTGLHKEGVLIQYILYSAEDVRWYEKLVGNGVIPGGSHLLLFVVGRYGTTTGKNEGLGPFVETLTHNCPWMACGFGAAEERVVAEAVELGGHVRVGFENNQLLSSGQTAADNAALVGAAAAKGRRVSRFPADRAFAVSLHKGDERGGG